MKPVLGLADSVERETIRTALDQNLVVEAAAGTGKTTELVQRVVAVVRSGSGRLSSLVALTFTEKAAGEMKLRLRTELDRALFASAAGAKERERLRQAMLELESAAIGTIHAFCGDLLRAHPVEASVDPAFEVADDERSRGLLARAFDGWFGEVCEAPPEGVRRMLARAAREKVPGHARSELLRAAARLIDTRDFVCPYRRDPFDRERATAEVLAQVRALAQRGAEARDPRDPLGRDLRRLEQRLAREPHSDLDAQEALLVELARDRDLWRGRPGRGARYADDVERAVVVAQRDAAKARLDAYLARAGADLAACLFSELREVVQRYEETKRALGVLDFFDLLLAARQLLCEHAAVRARVQARVSHVFVDEFQDTDPVQSEIMLLLAADSPHEADPWLAVPTPGKLFVVGDPKQSIYRFRRADVLLYERVKRHLMAHGAVLLELSTSFRSLPAIQSLVNAAFSPLMQGDVARGQASYVPLSAFRPARDTQPALVMLPAPSPYGRSGRVTKGAVNESLPDAVAAFVDHLVHRSGYLVQENGEDVPLAARHVCLLFRRFRAWDGDVTREYVRALEARRIPHVLAGGRSFFAREEVTALLSVLRAIEWPDDGLWVYATLRGPFAALHDHTLLGLKARLGHLSPLGPLDLSDPSDEERDAVFVLGLLRRLHEARNRVPIAQTVQAFLSALRVHAGVAIWPTGEQALANVLHVVELSRSYERSAGATSFRGFVELLRSKAESGETAEATVVEEGSDGVRVMTVHAAKGLEFPVVVLCDPTAPGKSDYASRFVDPVRGLWAQPLCGAAPAELVEHGEQVREQDQAELVRLLYVAVTRARELLVVLGTGAGPIEGWLSPLSDGVFPAREDYRATLATRFARPKFGPDSVVRWPLSVDHVAEEALAPGEHRPVAGTHVVTVWDPHTLRLDRPVVGGLAQERLLRADGEQNTERSVLEAYQQHREARALALAQGATPSLVARSMTELSREEARRAPRVPAAASSDRAADEGGAPASDLFAVRVLDSGADRSARVRGARFGTLVHALFQHSSLDPEATGELQGLASLSGRLLRATAEEVEAAVTALQTALGHPLFQRARAAAARRELYRELPVTLRNLDASLEEGVVDLAFREVTSDGPRLVVVDYKTDVELVGAEVYACQLARYEAALSAVFHEPVETLIFRV